ncbi:EF-hand domain family protein [Brugia pahangi]
MFSQWLLSFCVLISLYIDAAPPNRDTADELQSVDKQRQWNQEQQRREEMQKEEIAKYVKYMKYLETVLSILQATPQWKEAMQNMTQEEMRGGKIAEMVNKLEPHIIEQLAKAKILELQRLEQEIKDQLDADGGATDNIKIPEHLDFNNWETFSQEDLRKLVVKVVADMDELEHWRKQDFKQYEMKKKAEEDHKMAQMIQTEREHYIQQMEEQRRLHNKHEPLKHPGSRNQLKKVWEDTDKLDKDTYDPTTLFGLHDRNGDGYWSYDELNTIFLPEIEKLNNFSDLERLEELYRMRDHVMKQMDADGDHRISLAEFLEDSEAQEEKPDQGWEDIGDKEQYTKEELEIFEKEYAKQQGWGEYAYSTPAPTSNPSRMEQPYQIPVDSLDNTDTKQHHQMVEPIQPMQQHQIDDEVGRHLFFTLITLLIHAGLISAADTTAR